MDLRTRIVAPLAEIKARGRQLVELNIELLAAELREKGAQYGVALALLVGAAFVAFFAIGFALATIAVVLALVLPLWLAMLIVTLALVLTVAVLALVGRGRVLSAGSPVPEKAVAEARATVDAVRAQVTHSVAAIAHPSAPLEASRHPAGQAAPFTPEWRVRPPRRSVPASRPVVVSSPERSAGRRADSAGEP